ncbi:HAMP domain-containing sensor histidine kinase [Clostridium isatidis]|uniref:HAMP domain-containing sensor histidine kinase n=1 Tax=Clostridium isatidis TaxID=182773 RepID=UPI000E70678E|nr:HAMP domain-containing sensor histidine kinase [Clostridium isatidis]
MSKIKKTLKGRLLKRIVLTTILINLFLTILISFYLSNKLKKDIIKDYEKIKITSLNFMNEAVIKEESVWKALSKIYNINKGFVTIVQENNIINQTIGELLNEKEIHNILVESNNIKSIITMKKVNKDYIVTFNYPIYKDNNYLGNLIIQNSYKDKYNDVIQLIQIISLGQVVLLIMLIIIINVIINKTVKPILDLSTSMNKFINKEEAEDIEVNTNDEISLLANSYNIMKAEIIKSEKNQREFFNNATHELKTPITSISAYAQILRDINNIDDDFIKRSSNRIVLECNKMISLVEKLLELSRGKLYYNKIKEKVNVKMLILNLIKEFEIRLKDKVIVTNIDNIELELVREDVKTIFSNLIDNSIKYGVDKEIYISLYDDNKNKVFEIKNKMGNIPKEIKYRLLDPFIKYNNIKEKEKEITTSGLGLYICNEISKENGWNLNYYIEDDYIRFRLEF